MRRVVIIYRFLPQYRVPFYEGLREVLRSEGVELTLVHGDGDETDRAKSDLVSLPWASAVPNRIINVLGTKLYWQPVLGYVRGADLVVVEQASRLLANYLLLAAQAFGGPKIAFWGHGRNFQARDGHRVAEGIKRVVSTRAAWWFAYNERSAAVVTGLGYPRERVTVVQNAIDTTGLRRAVIAVGEDQRDRLLRGLGLMGRRLGLYVGGLYEDKHLPFLVESAARIRCRVPDFELIIAGDGPDKQIVLDASSRYSWIRYVGPTFGHKKAELLATAHILMMPGAVGLAVLDAFAAGIPIATTDVEVHGPEIEYLVPGWNSIVAPHDVERYADSVAECLFQPDKLAALGRAALASSDQYTIENMVGNFSTGILEALALNARDPLSQT